MNGKLYIKKFIRDDGETLSFDAEEIYLSENNTLLVRSDPATTAVEFTEEDGGEMIRQRGATYSQPVSGLIVPKSTEYWALCVRLSRFFILNHTYKIVYIKRDGSMFSMNRAWINAGLQIVPVPYENYSTWTIEFKIGDNFWTEYAEDSQGKEIYSNSVELPLLTAGTGGEVWNDVTQQTLSGLGNYFAIDSTSISASINALEVRGDANQDGTPTPINPTTIDVVTGEQTVGVTGRNLFNESEAEMTVGLLRVNGYIDYTQTNRLFTNGFIKVSPNTTYTFQFQSGVGGKTVQAYALAYQSDKTTVTGGLPSAAWYDSSFSFTTGENDEYVRFSYHFTDNATMTTSSVANQQLEKSSTATTYEPYQSQSYTISLGSLELRKIGNYQDYIYKSGDDWYVHRETDKSVYSSSAGWNLGGAYDGYQGFYASQYTMVVGRDTPIYTNYFKQVPYEAVSQSPPTEECFMINANSSNSTMIFYSRIITSLSELNDYFSATPMLFYFPLKTHVDTQITDATLISQLNALAGAQAYSGKTVYQTNSNTMPAILSVELLQSVGGGEIWDNVGAIWEEGVGGVQTINVETTQTTYPVWTVTGPCSNPTLQNDTTDTLASFDGMIASGQTLTVNFADNTAYLDSAPVAKYVSGYVSLAPGENVIGFNSDGGSTQTSTISWNNVIN